MNKNIIFICLVIFLVSCGNSSQREIKVKNAQELENAIKQALPGDQIILSNGTWTDLQLNFYGIGTKEKPITIKAETPDSVFIEGKSYIKIAGEYLVIKDLYVRNGYSPSDAVFEFRINKDSIANHCTVTNCVIEDFSKLNRNEQDHWVIFWGRHNMLSNCYIAGKFNQGPTIKIYLAGNEHINNYHQIVNNYFGPRPRKGGPKAETIQIGSSFTSMTPSHTIIANNYFEKCNGEVEVVSNKSNNCEIRNNVFFECEGSVVLRHGNYCIVDGNFFIGNGISTFFGGIRVINTGHWITNNYFYNLKGNEFRSPLAIMNGIPKSPLNRYNQVTDVVIAYNSWIDCLTPWQFSVGNNISRSDVLPLSEIRSARPERVEIADNLIYNQQGNNTLIKAYDKVDGIEFNSNLAINQKTDSLHFNGIEYKSEEFEQKGLWAVPTAEQVKDLLSVYKGFEFENIDKDIFGNSRKTSNNIGAMVFPLKQNNKTIDKDKYGPSWFKKKTETAVSSIFSITSAEELTKKLEQAKNGDVIELESVININTPLKINKKITIRSKNKSEKARIVFSGKEGTTAFEMNPKGELFLENILLSGEGAQTAFAPLEKNMSSTYNLFVKNCEISDFKAVLMGYKGSMAEVINFTGVKIKDCQSGLVLAAETDDKGDYNAEEVILDSCKFETIKDNVINFYRGGYDESTIGGCLTIKNCKFTNCGGQEQSKILIKTRGIVNVLLENNVFESNPVKYIAVLWGEKNNKHMNNKISQSGEILVEQVLKQKLVY